MATMPKPSSTTITTSMMAWNRVNSYLPMTSCGFHSTVPLAIASPMPMTANSTIKIPFHSFWCLRYPSKIFFEFFLSVLAMFLLPVTRKFG